MKISSKILLYILSPAMLTFALAFGIVGFENKQEAFDEAMRLIDTYAREYSNLAAADIQKDISSTFAMADAIASLTNQDSATLVSVQEGILTYSLEQNANLLSTWVSWELSFIKPGYVLNFGRHRYMCRREGTKTKYTMDELDLKGDSINGLYYKVKLNKVSDISLPYAYSYNKLDSVLEVSVWKPILMNDRMIGLVGVDVSLERYESLLARFKPYPDSYVLMMATNSTIIASGRGKQVNTSIESVFPETDKRYGLQEIVKTGKSFTGLTLDKGQVYYISIAPVVLHGVQQPWSLAIVVPREVLIEKSSRQIFFTFVAALLGMTALTVVVLLLASSISQPLNEMADKLSRLERGIQTDSRLSINSSDEIGDVARSVNRLVDMLNTTARFAIDIGQGKLETTYQLQSNEDMLGHALLEMRENLIRARQEEQFRKDQERQQMWIQKGIADSGIILRQGIDNLEEFGYNIISFLVKFIGANQGGFFEVNDQDPHDLHISLVAAYAFDKRRIRNKRIETTEGLVSRVLFEKESIYLTNIPENYFKITSGFGEKLPTSMIVVPLMFENLVYGIIEIASFEAIEPYQQQFLDQVSERIGAFLANLKKSIRTNELLSNSQRQTEELIANERHSRQQIEELLRSNKGLQALLDSQKGLLDAMRLNLAYCVFSVDGVYLHWNDAYLELYGLQRSQIDGQKHDNVSLLAIENPVKNSVFWNNLSSGVSLKRIERVVKHQLVFHLQELYTPLTDDLGNFSQILCFGWDVTEFWNREVHLHEAG